MPGTAFLKLATVTSDFDSSVSHGTSSMGHEYTRKPKMLRQYYRLHLALVIKLPLRIFLGGNKTAPSLANHGQLLRERALRLRNVVRLES